MDYVEGATDELPGMVQLSEYANNPPVLPEELITGVDYDSRTIQMNIPEGLI